MNVEGIKLGGYLKKGFVHLIILVIWAIVGFVFSIFNPAIAFAMGLIAPIPMIVIFGHLGGKFKKKNQAGFAGILIGLITGAVAGLFMANEIIWQLYVPFIGSQTLSMLSYASFIAISRAIFGWLFAMLGFCLFRGKFR